MARLYFEWAVVRLGAMAGPEVKADFRQLAIARHCEHVVTTMLQLSCSGLMVGKAEQSSDGQA